MPLSSSYRPQFSPLSLIPRCSQFGCEICDLIMNIFFDLGLQSFPTLWTPSGQFYAHCQIPLWNIPSCFPLAVLDTITLRMIPSCLVSTTREVLDLVRLSLIDGVLRYALDVLWRLSVFTWLIIRPKIPTVIGVGNLLIPYIFFLYTVRVFLSCVSIGANSLLVSPKSCVAQFWLELKGMKAESVQNGSALFWYIS